MTQVLSRLRREHGLHRYRCATLLSDSEYQLLQTDVPAVAAAELKEALRWKVKDVLDFPSDAATLDAVELPSAGPGRPAQMLVAAAPNSVIAARMKDFDDARVPLDVIDIPELAQRNLASLFEEPNRGLGLLTFDENGGLLTFSCAGALYASRRTDIGTSQLAGADEGRRTQLLDRLTLELQRTLDTLDRQFSSITVSRVLVAETEGGPVLTHLTANLYAAVERLDLARVMDLDAVPELMESARQPQALVAIGLALRREEPET